MKKMKKSCSVQKMATLFGASKSGFYKWFSKPISNKDLENQFLMGKIKVIFEDFRRVYGSPRVKAELEKNGITCSKNRVARLMNKMGLRAKAAKKFKRSCYPAHNFPVAENLLERNFDVQEPNKVWVSDITYIRTMQGWLYYCSVIDLFNREVVGWGFSDSLHSEIAIKALDMAYQRRKPEKGLMFHSDRGVQYASNAFKKKLKTYGMVQSMSRKGNCWDNAVAESFFHSLKVEAIHGRSFKNRKEAEKVIFEYTEIFYNRKRSHSYLGMLSPKDFEQKYYESIFNNVA